LTTRRTFRRRAGVLGCSLWAAGAKHGFVLGVASYSLRKFPREKAIEMIKACNAFTFR
jgi:hypothetical protein